MFNLLPETIEYHYLFYFKYCQMKKKQTCGQVLIQTILFYCLLSMVQPTCGKEELRTCYIINQFSTYLLILTAAKLFQSNFVIAVCIAACNVWFIIFINQWVTQKLPQIYTANYATFPIRIRRITVQICGNFWVTQQVPGCIDYMQSSVLFHMLSGQK